VVAELAFYGSCAVRDAPEAQLFDLRARAFRLAREAMARCGKPREARGIYRRQADYVGEGRALKARPLVSLGTRAHFQALRPP
jgi:hypothetical protein